MNQKNTAIARMVAIDGWTLDVTDDEPRVRDIDLAERAGLKQPRDIRKLIQRSRQELEDLGELLQRVSQARYESRPGIWQEREVSEFWLTEHQALAILLQLRTPEARRLRGIVIRVFVAVRRGELAAPQQVPVLSTSPLVGDSRVHRSEIAAWCRLAARNSNVSVHRVHGEVRRQFKASGIYYIPLVLYPQARELLESLALGRLLLPSKSAERRLALVQDEPQRVLPFPAKPGA